MDSIWSIVCTILATGTVMILGNWAQHCWARKREVSDARRKYRESIVSPLRETLIKLGTNLEYRKFMDVVRQTNKKYYLMDDSEMQEFEKSMKSVKRGSTSQILVASMPLVKTITNEETRKVILQTFAFASLTEKTKEKLDVTETEIDKNFELAYHKLEDYIILAD